MSKRQLPQPIILRFEYALKFLHDLVRASEAVSSHFAHYFWIERKLEWLSIGKETDRMCIKTFHHPGMLLDLAHGCPLSRIENQHPRNQIFILCYQIN